QLFDQSIDHSAASEKVTFSQRVQVNNTYYKPGGPLFILHTMLGGCQAFGLLFYFARWAPALVVIEHHYFGKSQLFGNDSYTNENMRFLTLDNVMSDTVAVVDWWRTNVTKSNGKNSPVIVFGGGVYRHMVVCLLTRLIGSYGGSLATFLRINHPYTFFGAVASAGPVRAFLPVTDDSDRFNRYGLVSQYWLDHAPDAAAKVRDGFKQLQEMVDAGNFVSLS
ncbi:peptidase S28, partial [Mycena albidolilacea]